MTETKCASIDRDELKRLQDIEMKYEFLLKQIAEHIGKTDAKRPVQVLLAFTMIEEAYHRCGAPKPWLN